MAIREELAALEHERWASWMRHVFKKSVAQPDGSILIPPDLVARWQRQIETAYADLSELEKDSDRRQVDRTLALLRKYHRLVE